MGHAAVVGGAGLAAIAVPSVLAAGFFPPTWGGAERPITVIARASAPVIAAFGLPAVAGAFAGGVAGSLRPDPSGLSGVLAGAGAGMLVGGVLGSTVLRSVFNTGASIVPRWAPITALGLAGATVGAVFGAIAST
jgi:hypothetical protein